MEAAIESSVLLCDEDRIGAVADEIARKVLRPTANDGPKATVVETMVLRKATKRERRNIMMAVMLQ